MFVYIFRVFTTKILYCVISYVLDEGNPEYEDNILRNVDNFYHSAWDMTVEYLNLRQYRSGNFRLPGCISPQFSAHDVLLNGTYTATFVMICLFRVFSGK